MAKNDKTNAMRILEQKKIPHKVNLYECDEFIDAVKIADQLGQPYESSYKTLVTTGAKGGYFVFLVPIAQELDMKKAAKSVGQKSVEMIHVKDINAVTGYIRGGCTPIGMKKQYPTVIDQSARQFDEIIISAGRIGAQIIIDPNNLQKVTGAEFVDIIKEI